MIKIYDRSKRDYYIEVQYGDKILSFLYQSILGRVLLKIVTHPYCSKVAAIYYDSRLSVHKIRPFIKKYNIQMGDFENRAYHSFNDLFTRYLLFGKRKITANKGKLISPADAKLIVYPIEDMLKINVKQSVYTMAELLKSRGISEAYKGGVCLVFRLTMDDYHRYCHVESGNIIKEKKIDGRLHTVSSIAGRHKVFSENSREYQVIRTENMGNVVQMEVGAMLVGKIMNHRRGRVVKRGEEKGYFAYGGSTIIVLIPADKVVMDSDILVHSEQGIETKVQYGEVIGEMKC